jgi:DNA polymerase-3 subunit alpha
VFQLESGGMQNACKQVGVSNIDDINAICALYRPGPMQFIPDYARGKRDPSTVSYPHPLLEQSLKETHGIIVYQEQVMECAKIIAGYTLGGADMLRRAMGKKDAEAMAREREKFVEGAKRANGLSEAKANEIFALLEKFASYGFNKSHSAAYALIGYQTAYLKANHPVQFLAALLSSELGNADKVSHFVDEAFAMGIEVLGPDVNESRLSFTPVLATRSVGAAVVAKPLQHESGSAGRIRFGLAGIKGVGEAAAQKIIEERTANGAYGDFRDFVRRVDGRAVNRRVLECLVKTGAFDFTGELRGSIFHRLDALIGEAQAHQRDLSAGQESFLDLFHADTAGQEAAMSRADPAKAFSQGEMLQFEKELLGFYVSGHPLDAFGGLAEALDTCPAEQLSSLPDRTDFRVCGVVSGVTKRLSKRDNSPWAFFTLATRSGSVQVNCYSEAWAACSETLANENAVLVTGSVFNRDGDARLSVREAHALDRALPAMLKRITWVLRPGPEAADFAAALRTTLEGCSGETFVEIGFLSENDYVAIAEVSAAFRWRVDPAAFRRLRRHAAVAGCVVETKPVAPAEPRRWARRNGGR